VRAVGLELDALYPPRSKHFDDRNRPARVRPTAEHALRVYERDICAAALLISVCSRHELTPERRAWLAKIAASKRD
jgi:hypothetical protein